jgi:hypothetical protein
VIGSQSQCSNLFAYCQLQRATIRDRGNCLSSYRNVAWFVVMADEFGGRAVASKDPGAGPLAQAFSDELSNSAMRPGLAGNRNAQRVDALRQDGPDRATAHIAGRRPFGDLIACAAASKTQAQGAVHRADTGTGAWDGLCLNVHSLY